MSLTARRLNRATLARQLLLERAPVGVHDAIAAIMAIQAQEPASPYLALWNRIVDFSPADLDAAFADHSVVKATLMRSTLHAVRAEDHDAFAVAMRPTLSAARLRSPRFAATGLSAEQITVLHDELLDLLREPRGNAEIAAWFVARIGTVPDPGPWWALRVIAAVVHVPTGGPWSFGPRPAYRASRSPVFVGDEDAALVMLIRRYLAAFGPATISDAAQFGKLPLVRVRAAFETLEPELRTYDGPGGTLYDVADGVLPDADVPAPARLMPMWDSTILAYADRTRIVPEPYRKIVTRTNGDTLPTLLVDGQVAGVWRPVPDGIEASAFHRLRTKEWDGLAREAAALRAFLADREPTVYRRYVRWWDALPIAESHVLP